MSQPPRPFDARDLLISVALLTRFPAPVDHAVAGARAGAASWAFPLVGAVVGALGGLALWSMEALGAPPGVAAGAALAVMLVVTGALHEDGLADCADGFGGGFDRARRLEIMRDSRVGSFGVAALALALVVKWDLVRGLAPGEAVAALATSGALARGWIGAALRWVPPARADGLSRGAGRPASVAAVGGLVLAAALAGGLANGAAAQAVAAAAVGAGFALLAGWRCVGGQTGDVLGAGAVLAEIGALSALA